MEKFYKYGYMYLFSGLCFFIFIFLFYGSAKEESIPTGAVMFFNLSQCPSGWEEMVEGRGRYIVGLPAGGTPGATIGVALQNKENRTTGKHTHTVIDPGHVHNIKAVGQYDGKIKAYLSGSTNTANIISSELAKTGIMIQEAGEVEGTNAPYVQLLVCVKK